MTVPQSGTEAAPSFLQSLRSGVVAVSSALHTRLQLFVTELEEERERLKQALALALLLFFGVSLGFILLNVFLVAVFWQAGWVYAIGGLALLYLINHRHRCRVRAPQEISDAVGSFPCHVGRIGQRPRSAEIVAP